MITKRTKTHTLIITPSIDIDDRHLIEEKLEQLGYIVTGAGTDLINDRMDISFKKKEK